MYLLFIIILSIVDLLVIATTQQGAKDGKKGTWKMLYPEYPESRSGTANGRQ
jgi:hypothetical protein